ncbi:helix-turn-helix domain-containing protein [Marinobacterium iners]|uniref:helix-turn-helix domain-containing protein n=1 Tax=Marinobacterium iners TaxID=48076 RepID=UPI001A8C3820|nr:helix-turn-helix transcriptional regulator [Marinobacterium iners]
MSNKDVESCLYATGDHGIMHIGENLKNIRKKMKMSQKELAEASGISSAQISRIEKGDQKNPQLETVVSLATNLGVSLEELVFGEKSPNEINYLMKAVDEMETEEKEFIKRLIKTCVITSQSKRLE